jgi:hypothetical protein
MIDSSGLEISTCRNFVWFTIDDSVSYILCVTFRWYRSIHSAHHFNAHIFPSQLHSTQSFLSLKIFTHLKYTAESFSSLTMKHRPNSIAVFATQMMLLHLASSAPPFTHNDGNAARTAKNIRSHTTTGFVSHITPATTVSEGVVAQDLPLSSSKSGGDMKTITLRLCGRGEECPRFRPPAIWGFTPQITQTVTSTQGIVVRDTPEESQGPVVPYSPEFMARVANDALANTGGDDGEMVYRIPLCGHKEICPAVTITATFTVPARGNCPGAQNEDGSCATAVTHWVSETATVTQYGYHPNSEDSVSPGEHSEIFGKNTSKYYQNLDDGAWTDSETHDLMDEEHHESEDGEAEEFVDPETEQEEQQPEGVPETDENTGTPPHHAGISAPENWPQHQHNDPQMPHWVNPGYPRHTYHQPKYPHHHSGQSQYSASSHLFQNGTVNKSSTSKGGRSQFPPYYSGEISSHIPICPVADGQHAVTENGIPFLIHCQAQPAPMPVPMKAAAACAEACRVVGYTSCRGVVRILHNGRCVFGGFDRPWPVERPQYFDPIEVTVGDEYGYGFRKRRTPGQIGG